MVAALLIVSALFMTKPNTDDGPIKLRLGHITGESDPWHLGALKFAELVKEKTGGEIEVEVYASSMLGNDRDLIEGMQIGSVDFALPAGVLSNFYSPYAILELPYLFRDKQHLENVLYGDVGDELKQSLLDNAEVRGLEFWMRTPRELTANKKIETPGDLRGLKSAYRKFRLPLRLGRRWARRRRLWLLAKCIHRFKPGLLTRRKIRLLYRQLQDTGSPEVYDDDRSCIRLRNARDE